MVEFQGRHATLDHASTENIANFDLNVALRAWRGCLFCAAQITE